jgi:hypothetical protein
MRRCHGSNVEAAAQLFSLMAWLKGVDSPAGALSSAGEVQNSVSSFCSSISGRLIAFSFNGLQTEKFRLTRIKNRLLQVLTSKATLKVKINGKYAKANL